MFGKFRTILLVACSGALVVSATGCVGNADPVDPAETSPAPTTSAASSLPTTSPSPTAKPTPTPIPGSSKEPAKNWPVPKIPKAATEKSEEGVRAFALHWFDVLEYTYVTNHTKQLKGITLPSCIICAESFIDPADGLAKNDSWSTGGEIDAEVTLATMMDKNAGLANFRLNREDLLVYDKNADYYGMLPGTSEPDIGALVLEYSKGWQVVDLQWLDPE